MSLSAEFNNFYSAEKLGNAVLGVTYPIGGGYWVTNAYDFAGRVMISRTSGDGAFAVTPFSQLDRETLITMRDKLIDLRGNPPELPPEFPAVQAPSKKFNL
jgi:hypothetical protein